MTKSKNITFRVLTSLTVAVLGATVFVSMADAKGGRDVYVQDYQFDDAKHGYEGRATGGYYCSYQRLPNRVCTIKNGKEKCKIKGWTLRQICQ